MRIIIVMRIIIRILKEKEEKESEELQEEVCDWSDDMAPTTTYAKLMEPSGLLSLLHG
jgi:hypothetical protein